ncbi:MAG TPA: thiamine pyrophosphate-dependent enzyme, partial [Candidatus Tectomicrobia bacterium]|nr:thiamine pyrophosphate-dependent enzyme [Candidatus Tectomicrobia bacterium]
LQFEHSVTELVKKADAYNVAAAAVDGMDVFAVKAATQKALDYIRAGGGPYFLECRTYRFRAHSMFDAELYRSKAEVQEWKKRDPIATLSARLKGEGAITGADIEQMERKVADEVSEAVNFAEAGPWEPVEDLTRFVYSERTPS